MLTNLTNHFEEWFMMIDTMLHFFHKECMIMMKQGQKVFIILCKCYHSLLLGNNLFCHLKNVSNSYFSSLLSLRFILVQGSLPE